MFSEDSQHLIFCPLVAADEEAEHSDWEAEPERRPPLTQEDELEQDSEFGCPPPQFSLVMVCGGVIVSPCIACRGRQTRSRRFHLLQRPGGQSSRHRWRLEHHHRLLRGHPHRKLSLELRPKTRIQVHHFGVKLAECRPYDHSHQEDSSDEILMADIGPISSLNIGLFQT